MPIKFEIRIEEDANGVNADCRTFDSVASPKEIELGLDFKRRLVEWCKDATSFTGWKRPGNDQNRTDQ